MIKKLAGSWLIQLFCILWAAYLFLDYINYSNYFLEAYRYFKYTDLIITVLVISAALVYLLSNRKKLGIEIEIRSFRGIYHYGFMLLMIALIVVFYSSKIEIPNAASGTFLFIIRTIVLHLGLALILVSALSIGTYFLELMPITLDKTPAALVSLAIGFFIITMGLFLLGAAGILYQFVVIPFLIALIIPRWKKTFAILNESLLKKSPSFRIHILGVLAYVFIILMVALNLSFDTRIIPVGYDGLSLYMNVPKLIDGYHALTKGGDAYNWSLMMSLGFIMYKNTTIAILISVMPGILCLFAINRICINLKINRNWSLFACALFYSLPNTIWLSRNEEKIDLALLFITLCCVLLFTGSSVSKVVKKTAGRLEKIFHSAPEMTLWALFGILVGFTFGIKYTAMINIFAFLVVLFYTNSGKYGAVAIFFLNLAVIFALDLTRFAAFQRDHMFLRFIVPFVLAMISLFFAFKNNRQGLLISFKRAAVFFIAFGFTFLPWAIKNISENKKISFDSLLSGKSPLPALYSTNQSIPVDADKNFPVQVALNEDKFFKYNRSSSGFSSSIDASSEQIVQLNTSKAKVQSASEEQAEATNSEKEEEIRRYIGYESGIIRFISLPYDVAMKTNVSLPSADSGILLLIIMPVFIFGFSIRKLPWNLFKIVLLLLFLIVSIISVQLIKGPFDYGSILNSMRESSFLGSSLFRSLLLPFYILLKQPLLYAGQLLLPLYHYLIIEDLGFCFVLVTLFSIPIYYLFRDNFIGLNMTSKSMIAFVFCVILCWLILSSGITYYGMAGFSLIPVIVALLATKEREDSYSNSKFIQKYVGTCAVIWFVLILPFQFMPTKFTYATDRSKVNYNEFLEPAFVKYETGNLNEREVMKQFFSPAQQNIINALNRDKNSRILNVSTFLNYFIVNNDTRIYKDNQLGFFRDIYANANNDKALLAKEFRKCKIKYVLVSLKTAEIDKTPDKSLTKKFDDLMRAMVNNPEFQLMYTNRIVERPDGDMDLQQNGVVVKAKYDVIGKRVLDPGTDALFEVL